MVTVLMPSRRLGSRANRTSFLSGQAIPVDGGYTAGRDRGLVQLFGFPD